jgi:hypothetical protein
MLRPVVPDRRDDRGHLVAWESVGLSGGEEGLVHLAHLGDLIVGLESARVGEKPQKSTAEEFGLGTDCRPWSGERRPVCLEPEDRDAARPQHLHLGLQQRCASAQFGAADLAGGGSHPPYEVRDADTQCRQDGLFVWRENCLREPTGAEQLPEAVPTAGEMQAELARKCPGIDSTEENAQVGTDQIGKSLFHTARRYPAGRDAR